MSVMERTEHLPEVEAFLGRGPLEGVIGGQNVAAAHGELLETRDPGSGQRLADVAAMQAEDVDRAVQAAQRAFRETAWARMPPNERGALLHRLSDALQTRKKIVGQIEALDAGKVVAQAEGDVQNCVDTLRWYADVAQYVQRRNVLAVAGHEAWTVRHPWGPCGFIFPWNFPILLIGWGIAPALAAGNTVVIKPAEDTPLSAIWFAQLAKEVGIPDGVINVVPGYGNVAGAALASHPGLKRVSFTGSPEVGRMVAEACGRNLVPVKLELGGKGAAVVFDDVDIDQTAEKLVQAITFHTGQVCCDATRWLVHQKIYDRFVDAAIDRLRKVRIGYQLDRKTQMGPVVSDKQRRRVLGYLQKGQEQGRNSSSKEAPRKCRAGRAFMSSRPCWPGPWTTSPLGRRFFGPVAYLAPFRDEDEGVRMANQTDYGLANSVWSSDLGRAARVAEQLVAGSSWINGHNLFPHGVPYGGVRKSGMGGGVLSVETLFDYWRSLSVVRPL